MSKATYFAKLNACLKAKGDGQPVLVLDVDRVTQNARAVASKLAHKDIRLVVKSLPSLPLLSHLRSCLNTKKYMVFHRPFLSQLVGAEPDADILLGKPMPVQAVRRFYERLSPSCAFDPRTQLQWLIDTQERLQAYLQLAEELDQHFRINLEINIGLHRGGLDTPDDLMSFLSFMDRHSDRLTFTGFMGYDAHVPHTMPLVSSQSHAMTTALAQYKAFVDALEAQSPNMASAAFTFNGGGSPTYTWHGTHSPLTEISLGSCLVKPTDFDLENLGDLEPALFIATPVLKRLPGVRIPSIEKISSFACRNKDTLFLYGGRWMARPDYPESMQNNRLYGQSSNQQSMLVGSDEAVAVDDYVFLRPTQSEAVMLQFGDIMVVQDGAVVGKWPVLNQAG